MSTEISDALNWVRLAFYLNLVGFHSFLNRFANIRQPHINASFFDACVCRILDCRKQIIELGIKGHRKSTISHQTPNVAAIVNFHDITVLKYSLVAQIWCVVRCTVIQ